MFYAAIIIAGVSLGIPAFLVGLYYAGLWYSRGYQRAKRESLREVINECLPHEEAKEGN